MGARTQEELAFRLRRADPETLLRLVEEHLAELALRELRQVLLNPFATTEVVERLAADRRLTATREVRSALARHPRTPEPLAIGFLPGLFWRDLLEVGLDPRARPPVRRVAERYLLERLPRLAIGEKISLARRAGSPVLGRLLRDPDLRVVRAALENGRLTEPALAPLLASHSTPPRVLELIANHPRWRHPYGIRRRLASHPLAPLRVAFRLLGGLSREDLRRVAAAPELCSLLRSRAKKMIEVRRREGRREASLRG